MSCGVLRLAARRSASGAIVLLATLIAPGTAQAQWRLATQPIRVKGPGVPPPTGQPGATAMLKGEPTTKQSTAPESVSCDVFVYSTSVNASLLPFGGPTEASNAFVPCVLALQKSIEDPGTPSSGDIHLTLVQQRNALRRFRKWAGVLGSAQRKDGGVPDANLLEADAALDASSTALDQKLRQYHLLEPVTGEIKSGYAWSFAGSAPNETPQTTASGSSGNAAAYLAWETMHFGEEAGRWFGDFSIDGRFGATPALTLVTGSQADGTKVTTTASQDALAIDFGVLWNIPMNWMGPHLGELSIAPRFGTVALNTLGQIIDVSGQKVLAFTPANGVGRPATVYDITCELKLYNNPLEVIHLTKEFKSPMLLVGAGWRHDTRFKREGDLVAFDAPESRFVFHVAVNAVKFLDGRDAAQPPKPVTLSFEFQLESHWGRSDTAAQIPAAYRFLIRGDLDILKSLAGGK